MKTQRGWPDIFICNDKFFCFVDVKSANDKLRCDQINWIKNNNKYLGFNFQILRVHDNQ